MVQRTEERRAGFNCVRLANQALSLWVTRSVGPRIIGLALHGGENLLAVLPDEKVECPGVGTFSFRGGHRLWYAPEDLGTTYLPDDAPVGIEELPGGIAVTQAVEKQTGIQKSMAITLPYQCAQVVIDHTLHNQGTETVDLAPWAITQLKPRGIGILPQAQGMVDEEGLLPNRQITLWPYTKMNSPHIQWGDEFLFVMANMTEGAFKVGFPNPRGWLAYGVDGTLFVKEAIYDASANYYDHGSSSECYCNPRFIELETLGPRTSLAPGAQVTHRETWLVWEGVSVEADKDKVQALIEHLCTGC